MKIAVLYRTTDGPWGGGNTFLRSLKKAWREMGIEVNDCLQGDLEGVLINSSSLGAIGRQNNLTPEMARRAVRTGYLNGLMPLLGFSRWRRASRRPSFVHRLDGVFRLYGRRAGDPADVAQLGINRFMDWTIYQSEFCRQSFAEEGLDVTRSTVIFNGVDTDLFYPASKPPPMKPFRLVMVSWSPNIHKGAPYAVQASQIPDVEVTFVGQWPPGLLSGKVRLVQPQTHNTLPGLLRQQHVLIHMALNEPGCNSILEGLACGLPVIYHPSGGSPEVVNSCGVPGESDLKLAIEQVQDRYYELRSITIARIPELSIKRAAKQYIELFKNLYCKDNCSGRYGVKILRTKLKGTNESLFA